MRYQMNKKSVSLPIVILVISMMVLLIFSLIIFYNREKEFKETIKLPEALDKFYVQKILIESNLEGVFESASDNFVSKEKFIEKFKERLVFYENSEGKYILNGFDGIKEQIIEENVELSQEKLVLKLNVFLEDNFIEEGYEVNMKYSYELALEKLFK